MNIYSTVLIGPVRDGRGPVTSAHLRNYEAFIDNQLFGYFETKKDAEDACMIATGVK